MDINQVAMGCKPDPYNFRLVHLEHINGNTIVVANYGGETFNGNKLMVLRGTYEFFNTLDPHFLSEDYPVIARFIPTEEGMEWARLVANNAGKKRG